MKREEDYLFVVVFASWFTICFRFEVTSANSGLWVWWWVRRLLVWIVFLSATVCFFVWLVSCAGWLYGSGCLVRLWWVLNCVVRRFMLCNFSVPFLAVFAGIYRERLWPRVCCERRESGGLGRRIRICCCRWGLEWDRTRMERVTVCVSLGLERKTTWIWTK